MTPMHAPLNTVLSNFDDSLRILAKLMARENLTVQVVDGLPTAMFDTVRRVLSIPNWTTLTRAQFDMLIGHEVGHALFTDNSFIQTMVQAKKAGLMSYFNVVEDARIERKMKNVYPGLAKDFFEAYQTFTKQGPLFKIVRGGTHILGGDGTEYEIAKSKLIDRINLFFKIGAFVPVPFDKSEYKWLHRIQKCPDMETALQIAKDLHEYAKEDEQRAERKREKSKSKMKPLPGMPGQPLPDMGDEDEDEDSDGQEQDQSDEQKQKGGKKKPKPAEKKEQDQPAGGGSGDEDEDEQDEDSDETSSGSGDDEDEDEQDANDGDTDESDDEQDGTSGDDEDEDEEPVQPIEDPVAKTDKDIQDALKKIADENKKSDSMRHLLYGTLTDDVLKSRIVTARDWSESVYASMRRSGAQLSDAEIQKHLDTLDGVWSEKFMATAKAMAAEFERRKTAKNYQRAQVSKTGRLDMSKLHQYKFAEDLFLRTTTVPNGQSHGFVMIIDASGSMDSVFPNVVDQALLFAVFCYYAKIPCEVYLFSDIHGGTTPRFGPLTLNLAPKGQLVGMVNTVTDRGSFHQQIRACLALKAKFRHEREVTDQRFYQSVVGVPYGNLNGTPLYTGIMLGEAAVARMKRNLKLDKMIFAVVSDGGDTDGVFFEDNKVDHLGRVGLSTRRLNECRGVILRDMVTKENHIHVAGGTQPRMPNNGELTMLLDIIRKRHAAQTVYFFLAGSDDVSTALSLHVRDGQGQKLPTVVEANRVLREQGQYIFPAGAGVADLTMILPASGLDLKDTSTGATVTKRGGSVVDQYVDVLKDRQNSRKFVNAVIPFVA